MSNDNLTDDFTQYRPNPNGHILENVLTQSCVHGKLQLTIYLPTMSGMNKARIFTFLTLLTMLLLIISCAGDQKGTNINRQTTANASNENTNSTKTNIEELGLIIKVPYETEDIVWRQDAEHKKLLAVLRFSPEDATLLVADSEKFGSLGEVSIAVEPWFPEELTAQSEMNGDNALKGMTYPANVFFQPPYTAGRLTRIEGTDYFVLELTEP